MRQWLFNAETSDRIFWTDTFAKTNFLHKELQRTKLHSFPKGRFRKFTVFQMPKLRSSLVFLLNKTWEEGIQTTQWDFCLKHEGQSQTYTTEERELKKKYFDSNESMRKTCRDFVTENPNFKSMRSPLRNKGPAFRNKFHEDLSDLFSFRKARVDTCQFCGETINKINILSQSHGDPRRRAELKELKDRSAFRSLLGKWSKVCFDEIWHECSIL